MSCGDMARTIEIKKFDELTARELYDVLKLRQDVFVIEQTCIYPDMDGCDFVCHHALMRNQVVVPVHSCDMTTGTCSSKADCLFIQGQAMGRPSEIRAHVDGALIQVGGSAAILAEGEIRI